MRYRRLDAGGDMLACCGAFEGADAVAAAIRSRLLSFRGEWWEFPEDGIPLLELVGKMNEEREQMADMYIRQRILGTQGVDQIVEYRSEVENSKRSVFVVVTTTDGETASVEVAI